MKEICLPPSRACGICRNRMNEVCLENCAPEKKYGSFEPDMTRPLDKLPTLTFKEYLELPGAMKGRWLFIQQTKLIEFMKGEDNGRIPPPRPYSNHTRSRGVSSNLQEQDLLPGGEKEDTPHPHPAECPDNGRRPNRMAEKE